MVERQPLLLHEKGPISPLHFFPGEEKDAEEVAHYIEQAGRKAILLPYDLRDEAAPQEIVEKAVKGLGGLDTLCFERCATNHTSLYFRITL